MALFVQMTRFRTLWLGLGSYAYFTMDFKVSLVLGIAGSAGRQGFTDHLHFTVLPGCLILEDARYWPAWDPVVVI